VNQASKAAEVVTGTLVIFGGVLAKDQKLASNFIGSSEARRNESETGWVKKIRVIEGFMLQYE
jgi:hypothetical protein